ncbi:MAG: tetratricopeptide repeat protein [Bacteroidales bacterium]|jgi:Ca-activated chloride channel family protein
MKIKTLLQFAFVIILFNYSNGQSAESLIRKGNRQYKKEDFKDSEISYRKSLEEDKNNNKAMFNLGDALFEQGKFDEASKYFEVVGATEEDNKLKSNSYYNLGNAFYESQQYNEAINSYKKSLILNPENQDARYNLAMAQRMLQLSQNNQSLSSGNNNEDKDDDKKQEQQQQQQQEQQEQQEQEKQQEQQQQKISAEDAEKILDALKNEEQEALKRSNKKLDEGKKSYIEKDW